jgi:streptogramin lyase
MGAVLLSACGGGSSVATTPLATTPVVAQTFTTGITTGADVTGLVAGPDGRIWFSEFEGTAIGATTVTGTVSTFAVAGIAQNLQIISGPDGNLWTGGYGGTIYKSTTSGALTLYPIAGAHIGGLTTGADGNIWFTDYGNAKVGRITPSGTITEFGGLPAGAQPQGIASGSDGNLWVTYGAGVAKVSTGGAVIASYTSGLTTGESTEYIVDAADGNLYMTEAAFSNTIPDKVAKVATSGTITEIGTLSPSVYPNQLAIGKDGNVYFQEYDAAQLGKITIASDTVTQTALTLSAPDTGTKGICAGADGKLYLGGSASIYQVTY